MAEACDQIACSEMSHTTFIGRQRPECCAEVSSGASHKATCEWIQKTQTQSAGRMIQSMARLHHLYTSDEMWNEAKTSDRFTFCRRENSLEWLFLRTFPQAKLNMIVMPVCWWWWRWWPSLSWLQKLSSFNAIQTQDCSRSLLTSSGQCHFFHLETNRTSQSHLWRRRRSFNQGFVTISRFRLGMWWWNLITAKLPVDSQRVRKVWTPYLKQTAGAY